MKRRIQLYWDKKLIERLEFIKYKEEISISKFTQKIIKDNLFRYYGKDK